MENVNLCNMDSSRVVTVHQCKIDGESRRSYPYSYAPWESFQTECPSFPPPSCKFYRHHTAAPRAATLVVVFLNSKVTNWFLSGLYGNETNENSNQISLLKITNYNYTTVQSELTEVERARFLYIFILTSSLRCLKKDFGILTKTESAQSGPVQTGQATPSPPNPSYSSKLACSVLLTTG
jgi:hypothetical protein